MSSSSPLATRGPLLARLCTQVDLCLGCPRCAQRLNESTYILCEVEHSCSREILLACFKGAAKKVWREVGHRPRFPRPWRYKVCRYYNPGLGCQHHWNRCTFARSPEEALVWTFELKHSLSRLWLKAAVQGDAAQDRRCGAADAILAEFGGHFQLLCAHCFRAHPQRLHPVNPQGQCSEHRTCPALLVHVSTQGRKRQFVEVRPKPQSGRPLRYCRFVGRGQPCRHGATRCQFAHSAVEMAVWEAEQLGGLQREVLCTVPTLQRDKGLAPNSQSPGGSQPPEVELYCRTCLLTYRSQEAFESHCASLEHSLTLAFDQATPWEHRAPPLGLSKFELCPRPDLCEYGAICTKAHSEQELQEWIQRAEAAELCEQAAWKDGLVPYRAWLLAEYQRSSCEALVMAETVCGVSITCHQPLVHQAQEKKIQHSWAFSVHSEDPLLHVALLKQEPGADFSLVAPCLPSGWLYASGERFRVPSSRAEFQVGVRVQTTSFGTFEQWVVFDFGRRPVLLRKLRLQLGQALCSELGGRGGRPAPGRPEEVDVWHTGNRHVVPCVERTAEQAALMTKYKVPTLGLKVSPSSLASEPISQANYRQNMHHFLYEEEAARRQLVAKLTLRGRVSLKTSLQTPALGMLFAPPGSLYAKVLVPSALTPDTAQGFLLGREVSTALVAPMPAPDNTVFEVWLEKRASLEQALWLLLPKHCCVALGLQAEGSPILEVQFQIDPLNFWFWHQAVDALPEERLVVPDLPSCALPCPRPIPPSLPGNHKQKLAVGLIAGSSTGSTKPVPPLLIYGPFGTGKTYTLAMATLEVIRQPHAKVLICTHTNSAADIYIREYFHGHVTRGHFEATPLRVMYTDRPPNQTDPTTLQYCCLTKDARAFRPPTQAELVRHCVVVTTTSQARELRVPTGFFSHILIDEAAQMLECEALTPLAYASPCTHVVLAGDHLQVTPRLFSVPRAKAAGHTLLYRLFLHYQQEAHQIAKQSRIIFLENYRSTAAIIGFISRHFYLAKGNPIQASGKVPPHPRQYPLMFCHVAGTPEQDMSMTSWLNPAEVTQVVEKVQEVYNTWPYCWGVREQRSICAVSHGTQVSALRQELRRRNLGEVSVGSFETLPGREFRVVVLSTVHNRHSLISCGAPTLEFFTDARVLNTVMTRAQSQLVAVGDAMALCSFGACSKLWKSFIRECVEHNSIFPEGLSLGQIEQGVAERQHWASVALRAERTWASVVRGTSLDRAAGSPATEHTAVAKVLPGPVTTKSEATKVGDTAVGDPSPRGAAITQTKAESGGDIAKGDPASRPASLEGRAAEDPKDSKLDFWPSDCELNADDAILQELLDESRQVTVTVGEDGLLDTLARPASPRLAWQYKNLPAGTLRRLMHSEPGRYRRCTLLKETFECASAVPLDEAASSPIQVRGRLNCGMAFTGDEVLVQVLGQSAGDRGVPGRLQGRVVGVLKRKRGELAFVCRMDEWDPRIMIPINGSVTKIFVADLKDPLRVPIHRLSQGRVQCVGHKNLTAEGRRTQLFWVRIILWRERFYYPLGIILEVLPEATSWEQGLYILGLEHGLRTSLPDSASISKALQKHRVELGTAAGHREDCRNFLTFTVDPQGAFNLDDALSVRDLGPRYEVAVHIADVASVVPRDGVLDVEARQQGAVFYAPDREPVSMLPAGLCQDVISLLPGKDRLAISLFLTLDKDSSQLRGLRFAPSVICSDRQLSYEEAEVLIRAHPGAGMELPACLDSVEACVVAACYFSRVLRRCRLQAACLYEPLDEDSALGFRAAHIMVQEYMIQFNSQVAEFLVGNKHTQAVTPLRCQPKPLTAQLEAVRERHRELVPLSLHLRHHLQGCSSPRKQMHLLSSLWKQVQLAARSQDYGQIVDLIATDDIHPSLAPPGLDFCKALGRSVFVCSSQGEQQLIGHYSLQLAEHPHDLESRRGLQLVWRRRIYSVQESKQRTPPPGTLTDPHVCTIDTTLWQRLLVLVQQERWPEAATLIQKHSGKGCQRRKLVQVNRSPCGHFLEVARELGSGDTLQVQVSASTQRGFLVPTLQLWTVAPGLSLCLEHAEHPVSCFSGHAQQASKERYCDEDEYSLIWGPLCSQESASNAVAENESIVLQHVCISWDAERTQQGQLQGAFHLDPAFLQENCTDVDFSCCYLCIRLEGLPVPPAHPASGPSSLGPLLSIDPDTYTWVAHGRVDSRDQEDQVDCQEAPRGVHFFIYHMAMEKVPENVLRPGTLFTVEVVLRQLPDLRKEQAVRRLKKASPLVISIALGRPLLQPRVPSHQRPFCRGTATRLLKQQAYDIPGAHPKLNASQNRAIRQALEKPFTLIQGPPGTGKTFVGLHIIFWFHKSNLEQVPIRRSPDGGEPLEGPCVLYCGPSNKSVDVLAGMLLSWRAELRPLRVYGEQCEATEFPVPGMGSRGLCNKNPREGRPGQALRNISLHHRIRRAPNPHAPKVREFDARVSRGEVFSKADLTVYRRVMWEARKFELARHSVILCTCCCAASHCLQTLKVQQILIDEASMTTEPETLIPLVHFSGAKKVVLLGDHKQLRPVVKNEHLRNLGMDKSLFERYHRDAHVLDTQYRMHEVICAFPSAEFYGGKLKTWQGLRRPPSILGHAGKESCPVIFGHVQGHEQRLLVTTEDGNENSRANPEEVAEVIRITKQLTLDRKVDPKDIAILTPYNAQAAAINKGLMREGVTGVTVSSITKSQGSEWRYVLVSTVCTCPKSDVDHWPTRSWLRKFLGFVVDPNQVNVAITRAQEGLCLIGDHILLSCCPLWRRLIDFCKAQQSFVPANKVRVWRRPAVSL
ncbi:helicase with zinc finger domain 2 isoform X1 [Fukomys damarensis]|uniref:helicase with zinc finger domain 2 isoform X1 n=1 Tax=Fukomys damarensis TaxID=885580 RepID=UPI00053FE786|nr:helicase with zinc finger domain 2 isoform X1 [Fukomys damarensis]XP_033622973.1 helicase with zinc finger domain 2 isoform X1 [Fukomys damarensis]